MRITSRRYLHMKKWAYIYEPEENSWPNWMKDLAALDVYGKEHPELKFGLSG